MRNYKSPKDKTIKCEKGDVLICRTSEYMVEGSIVKHENLTKGKEYPVLDARELSIAKGVFQVLIKRDNDFTNWIISNTRIFKKKQATAERK